MVLKADSGDKFDQGRIKRILALVFELTDLEFSQLLNKLKEEQIKRNKNSGTCEETVQL